MYQRVQRFLGTYGTSGADTDSDDETESKYFVDKGYRRFVTAYTWTWSRKYASLNTQNAVESYELPEDFRSIRTPFTFQGQTGYPPLIERTVDELKEMINYGTFISYPQYYGFRTGEYNKETGMRYEVVFWPFPDTTYNMYYSYYFMPEKLEAASDIPIGGAEAAECIMQMALAVAEEEGDEVAGIQAAAAEKVMQRCILMDREREPKTVGYDMGEQTHSAWQIARGTTRINNVNYTV